MLSENMMAQCFDARDGVLINGEIIPELVQGCF